MVIEKQFINAERFLELVEQPQYEDRIVELVEGELVEMSRPNGQHGEITMQLGVKIANHVYKHDLGRVTAAETGFILARDPDGKDTVRGLDIAFISANRTPYPLPSKVVDVTPDLAVEVVSPSNHAADIHLKVMQLLNAGTSLVWIVYPDSKTVTVHTTSGATTFTRTIHLPAAKSCRDFRSGLATYFPPDVWQVCPAVKAARYALS